jgi:hypothetical protein
MILLNLSRKRAIMGSGQSRQKAVRLIGRNRTMIIRAAIRAGIRDLRKRLPWLLQAAVAAVLIGCASTETTRKEPTLRDDFIEYRQIVVQAMDQVGKTMRAIDEISAQANRDPRPAYEAFAKAVHRLEVDSIKVRARTQAMRARGDAYFEHWEKYLAGVDNEQVRQRAEQHRAELKRSFEQAQQASQQVRESFRPFLSDVQKLRAILETEPTLTRIDSAKDVILAAKDKGRQLQQGLDRVLSEMNAMTALLRPPGTAVSH